MEIPAVKEAEAKAIEREHLESIAQEASTAANTSLYL